MKSFLTSCVLWLAALLIAAFGLDAFLTRSLKKSVTFADGEIAVWEDILNGRLNADTLIYGSSRAWVQMDPALLEEAFGGGFYNLGMDGYRFPMQYFRHLQALEHNPKPERIILSLDVFTLEKRPDLYNLQQFLPYARKPDFRAWTSAYEGFSFWDYHLPAIRYCGEQAAKRAALAAAWGRKQPPFRTRGYRGMDRDWTGEMEEILASAGTITARIDPEVLSLFLLFLEQCRENQIRVLLVYSPEYIEGQGIVKNREQVIDRMRQIAGEFNVPFLDYSGSPICRNRDLFYNTMHLNRSGSRIFTQQLIDDIRDWAAGGEDE